MAVKLSEYNSLAEVISRINSYMTSHGYNPEDYELTAVGYGSCTLESSPTVWYHTFCLREYANPKHEISINIPCYKSESHITCELLSRDYGGNKE